MTDDEQEDKPQTPGPLLREATEAEDALITRLSTAIGHRLLRDWEELPGGLRVLRMNEAFLAAIAQALGSFMGAVAVNEPDNLEGWTVLLDQTLAIARQTAVEKRELVLEQVQHLREGSWSTDVPATKIRVLVPGPKTVM